MGIIQITENKKQYLDLLLLADEQEDMIDRYLTRGEMFVLSDGGVKAECVVTKEGEGIYEIKNIAVMPEAQRKGYGRALIDFVYHHYSDLKTLLVGTGDCDWTLNFYKSCGFIEDHRVKDYFITHYDQPIFENGQQLRDQVVLRRGK